VDLVLATILLVTAEVGSNTLQAVSMEFLSIRALEQHTVVASSGQQAMMFLQTGPVSVWSMRARHNLLALHSPIEENREREPYREFPTSR
jgi:hypothetical protein